MCDLPLFLDLQQGEKFDDGENIGQTLQLGATS